LCKGNEDGKAEFEEVTDVIRWFSAKLALAEDKNWARVRQVRRWFPYCERGWGTCANLLLWLLGVALSNWIF
jgi:hypothetical protein